MLRIGFVGTGLIAWAHGLGLKAMIDGGVLDAGIVAVFDPHERRAQGFADAMGGIRLAEGRWAARVEVAARSDAVWVCTPTSAHREAVDAAVAAGRAVFCEKPLSTDLDASAALVAAVEDAGVPAQCGLVLRAAPVSQALKALIDSGRLGQPMAVVFRDDQFFPIKGHYASQWRADVAQAGGGCLIEHSIHDVDILRFCFGEVDSVSARTSNFAGYEGIEDVAAVTLSFASGMEAQLTSIWHDILTRGSTRRIEVFCRDGMVRLGNEYLGPLRIEDQRGRWSRLDCSSPEWAEALPFPDGPRTLRPARLRRTGSCLRRSRDGGRPRPEPRSWRSALVAHRLVDAAYRSADQGGSPGSI